jgi:hypothetical protein
MTSETIFHDDDDDFASAFDGASPFRALSNGTYSFSSAPVDGMNANE